MHIPEGEDPKFTIQRLLDSNRNLRKDLKISYEKEIRLSKRLAKFADTLSAIRDQVEDHYGHSS